MPPEKSSRSTGAEVSVSPGGCPPLPGQALSAPQSAVLPEFRWYHGQNVRPEPKGLGRFCVLPAREEDKAMQLIIRHFRDLTADELLDLAKLRISVFVVEQKCPYQEMDEYDRDAWHIWLADENGIQAYLRVLPPGKAFPDAAIGRVIAVKRHCGLASRLLQEGIRLARAVCRADAVQLEAQTYARGLYEKAGFRQVSGEFLEDGIPHIRMRLDFTDREDHKGENT